MNRRELIKGVVAAAAVAAVPAAAAEAFSTDSMRYIAWERIGDWCWRVDYPREVFLLRHARYEHEPYRLERMALEEHGFSIYDVIWHLNEYGVRLRAEISELLYGPQYVVWDGPSWGGLRGLMGAPPDA